MSSLPSATPSPSHLSSPPAQPAVQEIVQTEIMDSQFQSDIVVHEDNSAYFNSFPSGFRFCPLDYELIEHYLQKKVLNQQLPMNRIQEVELYNHEPDHLADLYQSYGEKEWYFFTPRTRKYPNGLRPKRAAGNGYWKATGADKEIHRDGQHVGFRKALVFYHGKPPKGVKSDWIMHEFRVKDESTVRTSRGPKDMKLDEWVLCKIYRKPVKSSREVHSTESQEEVEMQIGNVDNFDGSEDSPNDSNLSELVYGFDEEMENYMGLINPPVVDESNHYLPYNVPPLPSDSYNLLADNFLPDYNINVGYGDLFSSAQPISFKPPMQFTGGDFQPRSPATVPPMQFTDGDFQPRSPPTVPPTVPPMQFTGGDFQPRSPATVPPMQFTEGDFQPRSPPTVPPMQFTGGDFQPRSPATVHGRQFTGGDFQPRSPATVPANDDYWGFNQDNYYMSPQFECFNNNYLNASNFVPLDELFPNTTGKSPLPEEDHPEDHPDTTEK